MDEVKWKNSGYKLQASMAVFGKFSTHLVGNAFGTFSCFRRKWRPVWTFHLGSRTKFARCHGSLPSRTPFAVSFSSFAHTSKPNGSVLLSYCKCKLRHWRKKMNSRFSLCLEGPFLHHRQFEMGTWMYANTHRMSKQLKQIPITHIVA